MDEAKNTLDLLLRMEPQKPETVEVKIKRLSKAAGADVVFALKGLGYSRVAELKEMAERGEVAVQAVVTSVTLPDLKNPQLLERHGAATPAELLKKLLTPGEVEDLYRRVQQLSGYLSDTLEDVVKK